MMQAGIQPLTCGGQVNATLQASGHALAQGHVYVKTKLLGVSATAVVPIADANADPSAQWVFGPPDVATPQADVVNPYSLDGEFEFGPLLMQRNATSGNYYLQPFNSYYHWYYGHLPAAWSGGTCDVVTDPAGRLCRSTLQKTEYEKIGAIVQEGTPPPAKYLEAPNELSNLIFSKPAKVTFSFLLESAGYQNSFGFFTYNSAAEPSDPLALDSARLLFPNTSYPGSGGYMYSGDSISIGKVDPSSGDNAIGFYVAANGWKHNRGQGSDGNHFYSINELNPEEDKNDAKHMLLIASDEVNVANNTRRLWVAVEDIRLDSGASDRDYNDMVIQIDVYPADALVYADHIPDITDNENAPADADNDGVLAADDVDDNDPERAFVRHYPAEKGWATLLAEDNWPVLGDFDMNDMVVRYQVEEVVDSQKRVKDLTINYILEARGAAFHNGLAVAFGDKVFADNIEAATLNGESVSPLSDPTALGYAIFDDAWTYAPRGGNDACWTYNTKSECENRDSSEFRLALTFANAVEQGNLLKPPYNPFLFAHKTIKGTPGYTRCDAFNPDLYTNNNSVKDLEIHLPNKLPTQGQDVSMFGTGDDTTNNVDRFYLSKNNLPWLLNVPYQIRYPKEHVDISMAYPDFSTWVASGGVDKRDWYLEPGEEALVYDASNNASDTNSADANHDELVALPSGENLSLAARADGSGKLQGTKYKYVLDGNKGTVWSPKHEPGRISVKWNTDVKLNTVVIREAAGYEGRVGDWRVVDHDNGLELARGTGLANAGAGIAVIKFEATKLRKVDFLIDGASDVPAIAEFETYYAN